MMLIEIKSIASADIPDMENFSPGSGDLWFAQADVDIGEKNHPGADRFQFEICSLEWFTSRVVTEGVVPTGRLFVFRQFTYASLVESIESLITEISKHASTWDSFARQLNWYMQWEFENYRE